MNVCGSKQSFRRKFLMFLLYFIIKKHTHTTHNTRHTCVYNCQKRCHITLVNGVKSENYNISIFIGISSVQGESTREV